MRTTLSAILVLATHMTIAAPAHAGSPDPRNSAVTIPWPSPF